QAPQRHHRHSRFRARSSQSHRQRRRAQSNLDQPHRQRRRRHEKQRRTPPPRPPRGRRSHRRDRRQWFRHSQGNPVAHLRALLHPQGRRRRHRPRPRRRPSPRPQNARRHHLPLRPRQHSFPGSPPHPPTALILRPSSGRLQPAQASSPSRKRART